jgi:hypothetical protein
MASSSRYPAYIRPGTGIAAGHPIWHARDTGIALYKELPAVVFGCCTKGVYNADIFPLGNTGRVLTLLWLPERQLRLHARWEVIP